jgi:prephenate dehydrogenase
VRVGIAGLGLIGASLGLALRKAGIEVSGYEPDARHLAAALNMGAASSSHPDLVALARESDLLVLAAPPRANLEMLNALASAQLSAAFILTDTGSVKRRIAARGAELFGEDGPQFVAGHPMAGGASRGPAEARANLFEGARWYLCAEDPPELLLDLIYAVAARPAFMEAAEHDELMARLSHAPQLAAWAFASSWKRHGADPARGGPVARELARIASSDPGLWIEIAEENRAPILRALQELIEELQTVRADLEDEHFDRIRRLREGLEP